MERTYAEYAAHQAVELLAIDSPTGFTRQAAEWVLNAFRSLGYEARTTVKGGVLIDLGGSDENDGLLLEAHADTLGGMVAEIKGNGRLRLTALGGMRPENGEAENVRVYTRSGRVIEGTFQLCNASVHVNGEYANAKRSYDTCEAVLDEDVKSADDTRALGVEVGDIVCFEPRTRITGSGYIKSRFLDDKLSVGILLGLAKFMKDKDLTPPPPGIRPCDGVRGGGPRRIRQRAPGRHRGHQRGHGLRGRRTALHRTAGVHLRQGLRRPLQL